jgi:hypothetical protein
MQTQELELLPGPALLESVVQSIDRAEVESTAEGVVPVMELVCIQASPVH